MSPSPRVALVALALAASALVVPVAVAGLLALAVAAVVVVDALAARRAPAVTRTVATTLARGVPSTYSLVVDAPPATSVRSRQPLPPDVGLDRSEGGDRIDGQVTARRRGRHPLGAVVTRLAGPLGLGRWDHVVGAPVDVLVYPDLPAARRLAHLVRTGRFSDPGLRARGPLGLGTDFEQVREYTPDDDVRRINWRATERLSVPMANHYREDTERDVICLVDGGRLMAAPVGDRTRLDAALDAVAAVAAVADVVGDRVGTVAFDSDVRRWVRPQRAGGEACVRALFDLEPTSVDSDYERAFRDLGTNKRSLVMVFTDLLEEAAARPLLSAVPVLARRHAVVVATVADPELGSIMSTEPASVTEAYATVVAAEVLAQRDQVASSLRKAGAVLVDDGPDHLAAAGVAAYLNLKATARL